MHQRLLPLLLFVTVASVPLAGKAAEVEKIEVSPSSWTIHGYLDRLQFQVTGFTRDGRQVDLTRSAQYEVAAPDVLAIDARGLVIPLKSGTSTVRVTAGGQEASVSLTVDATAPTVSYREHVIPVLTRAGCNMGACHAAQYGKGGLKLSLAGYAPEQDYAPLVRDWASRRISRIRPEDSLILRKPTLAVPHEGGKRFEKGSYEYHVLRTWIEQGTPGLLRDEPEVVDLEVFPRQRQYRPGDEQQLRVVARYSDGTVRDVTRLSRFDSISDGVVAVDSLGLLRTVGKGQGGVMVRYQGQAKVSLAIVPYREVAEISGFERRNFIDDHVVRRWELLGMAPTRKTTDEEFLRRAFLDAIGTLPPPEYVLEFLGSTDANKREKLVAELLGLSDKPERNRWIEEWSAYWAVKWADLMRVTRDDLGEGGMWAFYNWIRASLRENKPFDQFVREIVTAQGSLYSVGPANYYRVFRTPEDLAENTAQIFLGVRLQCARCHHHPFEVYSQADFYGLAAFFTQIGLKSSTDFGALGGEQVLLVKGSGEIRHPRTREIMKPTPLLGKPVDVSGLRDRRKALADWLVSPENPLFARNVANRIWGYLMGTGLVEPVDDMRATNPPSNPELLDALARYFVDNGYDLRKLMYVIMTSGVYQLASDPHPEFPNDTRFYTHYNVKRLPAEVLLDAVDFACGTRERFPGVPLGTRAIELPDPNYTSYFLDTLGRPKRASTCECERTADPNLAQVLHLLNGDVVNRKVADGNGRVARLVKEGKTDAEIVRELYLVTLSRPPSSEELDTCLKLVQAASSRTEGLQDILWALINTREFLFNH